MHIYIVISSIHYLVDLRNPYDISIPLQFNGLQPSAWGASAATAKTFEKGTFVADTRQGGSCNVSEYVINPHCNGTHTECVGHISNDPISLHNTLTDVFLPSTLITISPTSIDEMRDTCPQVTAESDKVITCDILQQKLAGSDKSFITSLVVRSLPNEPHKTSQKYLNDMPSYFTIEAMQYLNELGVKHLLVDMPSIDRLQDNGHLSAHRIFWGVAPGEQNIDSKNRSFKTITEFIYVANSIPDGIYLLNLQTPAFVSDAAPSRPVLFGLEKSL